MRVIFLYICIVIGLVFRSVPVGTTKTVPFFRIMYVEDRMETECYPARTKGEVSYTYRGELKDYVYYFSDHLVLICLSLLLFSEGRKYRHVYKTFMVLQILNLVDYMITFNTGWFVFYDVVVTFNAIACFVLALVILNEYGRVNN
jgi:hypothetical protein